jgi:hypothetical protein
MLDTAALMIRPEPSVFYSSIVNRVQSRELYYRSCLGNTSRYERCDVAMSHTVMSMNALRMV